MNNSILHLGKLLNLKKSSNIVCLLILFSLLISSEVSFAQSFDLSLTKRTSATLPVKQNQDVTFTITIKNQGTEIVNSFTVSDYVPNGFTFSGINNPSWTGIAPIVSYTASVVNGLLTAPGLAPGDSTTVNLVLKLSPNANPTNIANFAEISAGTDVLGNTASDDTDSNPDTNPNNDAGGQIGSAADNYYDGNGTGSPGDGNATTDEDDHDGATIRLVDLALKKEISIFSFPPYMHGNVITFVITVENQGNEAVQNIEISDYLPGGFNFVPNNGWTQTSPTLLTNTLAGPLAAGASVTVDLVLTLQQSNETNAWVNAAEINEFEDLNDNPIGQYDFDSTPDTNNTNDGGGQPLSSADNFLDGNGTGLPGDGVDSTDEDDHDPAFVEVFDLALRKTLITPGPYTFGQLLTFEIEVFNQGNIAASNILINDYVPTGYTYSLNNGWTGSLPTLQHSIAGPLAAGDSTTLTLELTLINSPAGDYINYSEISSAESPFGPAFDADSSPNSNSEGELGVGIGDPEDDNIDIGPGNGAQDDHDPAGPTIFDLALRKEVVTATPSYSYGQSVRYRIVLFNQGSVDATNIEVTDHIPCGTEFDGSSPMNIGWVLNGNSVVWNYTDTLSPGASDTLMVDMIVRPCYTNPDNAWTNYAEISSAIDVNTGVSGVDIDSTPDSILSNDNGGVPDFNGDVSGSDNTISNEDGDEDDHDGHKIQVFDLALRKLLITAGPYTYDQLLSFEIEVFNQGNVIAEDILVSDYIPLGFTFVPNNGWVGGPTIANRTIPGPLAPGTSTTLLLQLTLTQNIMGGSAWNNYAEVSSSMDNKGNNRNDDADSVADIIPNNDNLVLPGDTDDNNILGIGPNFGEDQDDHDVSAPNVIDLALTKTIETTGPYQYGVPVTFNVTVSNQGNVIVQNIGISDYLPAGYTFMANNGWTQSSPTLLSNTITGPLMPGASITIDLILTPIANNVNNGWLNIAEIAGFEDLSGNSIGNADIDSSPDTNPNNDAGGNPGSDSDDAIEGDGTGNPGDSSSLTDEDDHDVALVDIIDVALRKTIVTQGPYVYGQPVTYGITVFNQGNVDLYNIKVNDYIPAGMDFEAGIENAGWTLNGNIASYTIPGPITALSSTDITITLITKAIVPGTSTTVSSWLNISEISELRDENGNDITNGDVDSDGDDDPNNDSLIDDEINGNPNDPNTPNDEDDHDIAFIEIFDLALRKTLVTAPPYDYGDVLTFNIEVFNQGNVPATDIVVNDYLPIGYTFVANNGWTGVSPIIQRTIAGPILPGGSTNLVLQLTLIQTNGGERNWINYSEIATGNGPNGPGFDADSAPNSNGENENSILPGDPGDDNVESAGDAAVGSQDDHDPAGPSVFDIALRKGVVTATPSYSYGQNVMYSITLINQGNTSVSNIVIKDYLPCGLEFDPNLASNANWTSDGTDISTTYVGTLLPSQSVELFVSLVVRPCYIDVDNAWTNYTEIVTAIDNATGLPGDDIDSNPDGINGNDGGGVPNFETNVSGTDNTIDNEQGDEDDHDPHKIQVFDLALRKVVDNRGPYMVGETATFRITVFNQGNVTATNILLNDYIKSGYSFNPLTNPGWTLTTPPTIATDGLLNYTISSELLPGTSIEVVLNLEIVLDANPSLVDWYNYAEIGAAQDTIGNNRNDDADSNPNTNSPYENQVLPDGAWDNVIDGIGVIFNEDEDDHDPDMVMVVIAGGLGDAVWKDLDGDGIQDLNEPGVSGVIASLMDCGGTILQTTVTDVTGNYFFNNLVPGNYQVQFDISNLAPGCSFTLSNVGGNDALDSDVDISGLGPCVFVNAGQLDSTYDAGLALFSAIGNFVWNDLNGNGIQNAGEPGIPGVQVNLYTGNGSYVSNTFTDATGFYLFDFLSPGDYYLEFLAPTNFDKTFANAGANNGIDSDIDGSNGPGTTMTTTLDPSERDLTWDAGFYECIPIGDLVWYDINKNDVWDSNENGINGLQVHLWRNQAGTWIIWETRYTGVKPGTPSEDGYFKFCAPPGQYYVQVVMPPLGLVRARPNIGNNEEYDSDITNANGVGTTATFTVVSGDDKCDIGAGYYPMAVAGNLVWRDDNQDGVQDEEEPKVAGVVVQAYDVETNDMVAQTTTDVNGQYTLDYLERGDIYVKFQVPAGYNATVAHAADDNMDSDVDHSYGQNTTRMFSMTSGLVNENIDLGIAFGALPVDWVDVDVSRVNHSHVVSWSTAKEVNVDYYVVERRFANEKEFTQIPGKVAASGNTNSVNAYSLIDNEVSAAGVYIYRVKQVDFDGKFTYSKLVSIQHQGDNTMELFPNPAKGETNLDIVLNADANVSIEIYDNVSKLVKVITNDAYQMEGLKSYLIDLNDVPAGVYNVKVTINGVVTQKKFIRIE